MILMVAIRVLSSIWHLDASDFHLQPNGVPGIRFSLLSETTKNVQNIWNNAFQSWNQAAHDILSLVPFVVARRLPTSPRATCFFICERKRGNICSSIPNKNNSEMSLTNWTNWGDKTTTKGFVWGNVECWLAPTPGTGDAVSFPLVPQLQGGHVVSWMKIRRLLEKYLNEFWINNQQVSITICNGSSQLKCDITTKWNVWQPLRIVTIQIYFCGKMVK